MTATILVGDALSRLAEMPAKSVHCVVTSPPYFGLRDYGCDGQIGLEPTPREFVSRLAAVFEEVWRVLRDDGTLWLNIGDSFSHSGSGARDKGRWPKQSRNDHFPSHAKRRTGLRPKELIGVPWMLAFALRETGWLLRSEIIWHKPQPMPESAPDRPTVSHEQVFLFCKRQSYFYDRFAILELTTGNAHDRGRGGKPKSLINAAGSKQNEIFSSQVTQTVSRRNARSVWTIGPSPFPESHFATMPPLLAERCILAGTSEVGCCPTCGMPWRRMTRKGAPDRARQRAAGGDAHGQYRGKSRKGHYAAGVQDASEVKRRILAGMREETTVGWQLACRCALARPVAAVVLDPFGGAGTTALAADRLRRDSVLIELSPGYAAMAERRFHHDAGWFGDAVIIDGPRSGNERPRARETAHG